jgi:trypsin
MGRRSWVVTRMAFGFLLAAPATALAISSGTQVTPTPPWTAFVNTATGGAFLGFQLGSESSCSGTIIAQDWVMTAGHCVVRDDSRGNPTGTLLPISGIRVVLGRTDLTNIFQGGQWTVDRVVLNPNYKPSQSESYDVALLHLKGALPGSALPLPIDPAGYTLSNSASPTAYGYGDVSETYPPGGKPSYTGKQSDVLQMTQDGSYDYTASCSDPLGWCMQRVGASSILHGDSGGAWVLDSDIPNVLGVTAFIVDFTRTGRATGTFKYAGVTNVTAPGIRSWISSTAGLPAGHDETIYRNAGTGASWLFEADGFRHPIPDGGTYECLTGDGAPVVNLPAFTLAELPLAGSSASCSARSDAVLLYGDGDFGEDTTGFTNIASALTASGFHVTSLPGQTTLPADLAPYGQVWHYGIDSPSAADQQALINYAKGGGGVFLTGERPCCETENQADATIVNALVVSVGGIGVGGIGDIGTCSDTETVNGGAEDGVGTTPNRLTTWRPACPGGMSNLSPQNVFVQSPGGVPVGAVFDNNDVLGGGRLAILMDVNWAQSTYADPATMAPVAQNLAAFLAGSPQSPLSALAVPAMAPAPAAAPSSAGGSTGSAGSHSTLAPTPASTSIPVTPGPLTSPPLGTANWLAAAEAVLKPSGGLSWWNVAAAQGARIGQ